MLPAAWAMSSHSSESAMATAPVPLRNSARRWLPAVLAHHSRLAKLQPAHSVTPSFTVPTPGTLVSSVAQPAGPALLHTFGFAPPLPVVMPSSTFGPSTIDSKSSENNGAGEAATTRLSIAHHQLLRVSRYPKVTVIDFAPAGLLTGMEMVSLTESGR